MMDPDLLTHLGEFNPGWMSDSNQQIFSFIRDIYREGTPLTLVILCRRLADAGQLEKCGGAGYISSLTDEVAGTSAEALESAKAIQNKHRKLQLQKIAQAIFEDCKILTADEAAANARLKIGLISEAPAQSVELFIEAPKFITSRSPQIDWHVKGVIERGANGFIAGQPKAGKSWIATDLAIALATGSKWLGFDTTKTRVALITREDAPALTAWRLRSLCMGRGIMPESIDGLWVNSKAQSPYFRLDSGELVNSMVSAIKRHRCQFVILDVMNVLHGADENDATEMRKVMDSLTRIHQETGASLCVLHHFNKSGDGNMTQRLRGSSAIAGWAEYVVAMEHQAVRKVSFELKAAQSPDPLSVFIETEGSIAFLREEIYRPPEAEAKRRLM